MAGHRSAPTFYTVAAGTKKSTCRSLQCQRDIYFVDSLKTPGKKIPIDCSVVGGRVPTELESGSGIIHHIVCEDAERFREKRPPARRPQRELEVDHKAPRCIMCGCSQEDPCQLTRADAGLEGEPSDTTTETVSCSWLQLNPPICSKPACAEKRKELPLRMRVQHA